ncbi:beta-phosphoglucomutase family hydrolase [Pontibacter harenae]|uniref:beta-phosphoglucomutase family hydrolase n=1 Tax=Pontibacter harenae TaxID=2894083 RepID=UPI001E4672C4|nr:beta-phosphoglucomutase family hydrolase [Pontibacter harenae]MCC9167638.1 beta-phosphoglucomutase family hydrolase [Pontibacter harenae]
MSNLNTLIREKNIKALILDMDGVITRTATLHAEAWKKMCDAFLRQRSEQEGKSYEPFKFVEDYHEYVDGVPRLDGVRNFLWSRGISLPEGNANDEAGFDTVVSLGQMKNLYFMELLKQSGVEVFDDTVNWVRQQKENGMQVAIVSASKNCFDIVRRAGVESLFEARVDGLVAGELKLEGKPAPDIFLEAAKRLGVAPEEAAIFEDAWAGVAAGKTGGFGLVVGVDRGSNKELLEKHGADLVINNFTNE